MTSTTTPLLQYSVLDEHGQVVYQGTISGCSHWVDRNPGKRVEIQRDKKKRPVEVSMMNNPQAPSIGCVLERVKKTPVAQVGKLSADELRTFCLEVPARFSSALLSSFRKCKALEGHTAHAL